MSRQRSTPGGIALRIQIVLAAAQGRANRSIARKLSTSVPTVLLWRNRYEQEGMEGIVEDRPRSGRPKRITEDREAAIVEATLKTTPKDATHWSVRSMARTQKVSPAVVHRVWKKHKLQPHRVETFKFSSDPQFALKVRDIVGLYLHPPEKALVLSVDEKSQIQALDRTQPILPLRPGLPSVAPMTTSGTGPLLYSLPWTCWKARSSVNASRDTGIRHFSASWSRSTRLPIKPWTSISSSTITERTSIPG